MTRCGQSRKDATQLTTLLTTKNTLRIGAWNVRTMFETGKEVQVAREMRRYKIKILGISEARWLNSGEERLQTGELLLYSGHEDAAAPHTEGVALMLSKDAQQALIRWKPAGSRCMVATFKTRHRKIQLNVIQCYAPTNDKDDGTKGEFYNKLRTLLDELPRKDINILMGDLNAKIGSDNRGYSEIMGTHGLGQMNENGELFAGLCADYSLVIGGSIYPHQRIHKATWRSPDLKTENQIDHICINQRFRRSMQNVRVFRGADVASDHHLVVTEVRMKLKKEWSSGSTRKRYNVDFLKDKRIAEEFSLTLSNRFQALSLDDAEQGIDEEWEQMKQAWTETCDQTLGKKTIQHKDWISAGTIKKIDGRKKKKDALNCCRTRAAKRKAQAEYTKANKEVKQSIKQDKKDFIENLAAEAEEAAAKGNMKKLYDTARKLAGKYKQVNRPIKDKEGNVLTNEEEQRQRWAEHFSELLNRPPPPNPVDIPAAEVNLDVCCNRPTKREIRKAIKQLKNGKAAGPDGIPAEAIKADITTSTEALYNLFGRIWENEEIPKDWRIGYLVKLPKKGDLQQCNNYRGIMLLSVPGKVLNRVILERLKTAIDSKLRDEQAGFRSNRSCTDQIATLRIIVEQSLEWNSPLYINFVDYEKAFDSLDRETLWNLLRHYGIPEKLVTLIKRTYEGMSCQVLHGKEPSAAFEVKTGVRQGCLLSPFLFLIAIDWIMRTTTKDKNNGIQWSVFTQLDDLDFADDLALLSHRHTQMQEKTTTLDDSSIPTGLNIHRGKTKIMRSNTTNADPIFLRNQPLEDVQTFVYLGSVIDQLGGSEEDIKARIQKARAMFIMLRSIWHSRKISIKTKIRIFKSNVMSVMLYGSETWRTTKATMNRLQVFVNNCLRRLLGLRWTDRVRNKDLWEWNHQDPVEIQICRRRWRWIGHTLRKPRDSITRRALTWNPQGKRKRGRPRNSWRRDLNKDMNDMGLDWNSIERIATDRRRWRKLVDDLCSQRSEGIK